MISKGVGRRIFIKGMATTLLGAVAPDILKIRSTPGKTDNEPAPEYRILGKTGLKVTTIGMG